MKKTVLFILVVTCMLFSVSSVFASDINDTAVADEESVLLIWRFFSLSTERLF